MNTPKKLHPSHNIFHLHDQKNSIQFSLSTPQTRSLSEDNFNNEDSNDDDDEWRQRRYSLQLGSKGYRRSRPKVSAQPQLDSEEENEQPNELLSRQNTM